MQHQTFTAIQMGWLLRQKSETVDIWETPDGTTVCFPHGTMPKIARLNAPKRDFLRDYFDEKDQA